MTIVAAEEIKGKCTKIDDKTVTVASKKDKDGKSYTFADKCKFFEMVKKDKVELSTGVKADVFKDLDKGVFVTITTGDDGKVTELVVGGGKKKKKDAN
jgi:hypothetical protein